MSDEQQPTWVAPGSAGPPPPLPPPAAPGAPPPGYGYPPPPGYGYPPAYPAYYPPPVHKPGIIALRPLGLGDVFDGSFNAIRRNPGPMVGLAALVVSGFLAVPAVVTVILTITGDLVMPRLGEETSSIDPGSVATLFGALFGSVAVVILTGMLVYVVMQAVLGRKATIEETWREVRGKVLRLLGLAGVSLGAALLVVAAAVALVYIAYVVAGTVAAVLTGLAAFAATIVFYVTFQTRLVLLAAPALVVEGLGVFASMNRAWELSRRQFWRLFGITLLTGLVTSIVGGILGLPFGIAGLVGSELIDDRSTAALVYVFSSYLSTIVTSTITTPFSAAVHALLYVDQRIRKEAFDVELIARVTGSPGQTAP